MSQNDSSDSFDQSAMAPQDINANPNASPLSMNHHLPQDTGSGFGAHINGLNTPEYSHAFMDYDDNPFNFSTNDDRGFPSNSDGSWENSIYGNGAHTYAAVDNLPYPNDSFASDEHFGYQNTNDFNDLVLSGQLLPQQDMSAYPFTTFAPQTEFMDHVNYANQYPTSAPHDQFLTQNSITAGLPALSQSSTPITGLGQYGLADQNEQPYPTGYGEFEQREGTSRDEGFAVNQQQHQDVRHEVPEDEDSELAELALTDTAVMNTDGNGPNNAQMIGVTQKRVQTKRKNAQKASAVVKPKATRKARAAPKPKTAAPSKPKTPRKTKAQIKAERQQEIVDDERLRNNETGLFFNNIDEVQEVDNTLIWQAPEGDDTIPTTDEEKQQVVMRLVDAMNNTENLISNHVRFDLDANFYLPREFEKLAWHILDMTVKLHEEGSRFTVYDQGIRAEIAQSAALTFEERLDHIVKIISESKRTCMDLLKGDRLMTVIGSPQMAYTRAIMNERNNKRKQKMLKLAKGSGKSIEELDQEGVPEEDGDEEVMGDFDEEIDGVDKSDETAAVEPNTIARPIKQPKSIKAKLAKASSNTDDTSSSGAVLASPRTLRSSTGFNSPFNEAPTPSTQTKKPSGRKRKAAEEHDEVETAQEVKKTRRTAHS